MRADYYSRYFPEETSPAPVSSSGTAAPYAVRSDPGIAAPEKRKRRKGLRVFLICLALLIVCSAAAGGIWHFWVAPALEEDPVEQGGDFGENTTGHLSDNRARCDIERAPVPTGASVTISSVVGEELTLQQIYRKVNPSIVLVQAYDDFGGGGQCGSRRL